MNESEVQIFDGFDIIDKLKLSDLKNEDKEKLENNSKNNSQFNLNLIKNINQIYFITVNK